MDAKHAPAPQEDSASQTVASVPPSARYLHTPDKMVIHMVMVMVMVMVVVMVMVMVVTIVH
jgi:hypothetical protein